ncbi:spidroin-1-like [Nomascus leucogenys]|uniref:spidroin-1-like n=1 Tax=Nomascus leucogenys TaxID=61853 RepID=UPI00122D7CFC|nr:spidroin-1-like [Nomascus leucogenys]
MVLRLRARSRCWKWERRTGEGRGGEGDERGGGGGRGGWGGRALGLRGRVPREGARGRGGRSRGKVERERVGGARRSWGNEEGACRGGASKSCAAVSKSPVAAGCAAPRSRGRTARGVGLGNSGPAPVLHPDSTRIHPDPQPLAWSPEDPIRNQPREPWGQAGERAGPPCLGERVLRSRNWGEDVEPGPLGEGRAGSGAPGGKAGTGLGGDSGRGLQRGEGSMGGKQLLGGLLAQTPPGVRCGGQPSALSPSFRGLHSPSLPRLRGFSSASFPLRPLLKAPEMLKSGLWNDSTGYLEGYQV